MLPLATCSRPKQLSIVVGVKTIYRAILVPGKQNVVVLIQLHQKNTGPMIKIRPILRWTVRVIHHHAGNVPGVTAGRLPGPHTGTGCHINGQNRI